MGGSPQEYFLPFIFFFQRLVFQFQLLILLTKFPVKFMKGSAKGTDFILTVRYKCLRFITVQSPDAFRIACQTDNGVYYFPRKEAGGKQNQQEHHRPNHGQASHHYRSDFFHPWRHGRQYRYNKSILHPSHGHISGIAVITIAYAALIHERIPFRPVDFGIFLPVYSLLFFSLHLHRNRAVFCKKIFFGKFSLYLLPQF